MDDDTRQNVLLSLRLFRAFLSSRVAHIVSVSCRRAPRRCVARSLTRLFHTYKRAHGNHCTNTNAPTFSPCY